MLVIAFYLIFEMIPVNYRPVLIEGRLEASYPSSTTLLVLSVMPTLWFQANKKESLEVERRMIPGDANHPQASLVESILAKRCIRTHGRTLRYTKYGL